MKKIIFIVLLFSIYSFGQTNKILRQNDSTALRTFSDLKYVDKTTLTGTVYVTDYIGAYDTSTSWNGAIQAAIDALEPDGGLRTGTWGQVGKVILPNLNMKITSPILMYSGITLEGAGASSNLYEGNGFAGTELITLTSKNSSVDNATIKDLKLTSTTVRAIGCGVPSLTENILNSTIENLTLNTVQGIIINEYLQASIIRNIYSYGNIDTLLYLYGNANVVENIDKEGGTGSSVGAYIYLNDLSTVGGACVGNILRDILIEGGCSANKSGMIIRNATEIILEDYWYEANNSDGYMLRIEGSDRVTIRGYFHSIEDDRKLKIDSTSYVLIEEMSSDAVPNSFYDCVEKDSTSTLAVNMLHTRGYSNPFLLSRMDLGYLFNRVYSSLTYADNKDGYSSIYKPLFQGSNWLTNPSFENSITGWSYGGATPDTLTKLKSEVAPDSMLRLVYNSVAVNFVYQNITISSAMVGKEFTFSAYVKANAGSGGWATTVIDGCGITADTDYMRVNTGEGWGIVTQSFRPQSAGTLTVGIYFVNLTDVYIDEAFLTSGGSGVLSLTDIKTLIGDSVNTLRDVSLPLAGGSMTGDIVSRNINPTTSLAYSLGDWDSFFDSLSVHFIKLLSGSAISAGTGSIVRMDADEWEFRLGSGAPGGLVDFQGNINVADTIFKNGVPIIELPDTTGITTGYVPKKQSDGSILWQPDVSTSGSGTFNPDGVTIDTTAGGLARVLPAKVTKWDSVTVKQDGDADLTDLADGELTASKVGGVKDADYGDVTVSSGAWAVEDNSHSHTIANVTAAQDSFTVKLNRSEAGTMAYESASTYFDTLSYSINIPDTVIAGDNAIWKIPNNITITEIAAFTNSGTVTFNIEERAETTPNSSGTDVIGSDLVADTDQQETSTFSNASIDRDDWLALVVASITGDPTLFGVTIKYIKAN